MKQWASFFCFVIPAIGAAPAGYHLPVRFEPRFEPPERGGFVARASTGVSFITSSGDLRLSPQLEIHLQRGAPEPHSFATGLLPGKTNDLRGNDPTRWRTGIPQYQQVRFAHVWRGIDLVYHGDGSSRLEYDFVVAPDASANRIHLSFRGAKSVRLGSGGELLVRTGEGEVRFHPPRILQGENPIRGAYRLLGDNRVGFHVGHYDHARPLVIDPVLGYAALLGNQGSDPIQSVAVDSAGNVYVAGTTLSEIPLVNPINPKQGGGNCSPTPGKSFQQCEDAFAAKFDPTGSKLIYSTYLGGDAREFAAGIAVDRAGNAYIAGSTRPAGFNTVTSGAWVMKLNASGSSVLYNRNIGGITTAGGIAVDAQGDAYVAGTSMTRDFPGVNALQSQAPLSSLLVASDSGVTWQSLNNNLPALTVNSLAIDPTHPSTLYAATPAGLYKSVDAGANWTQLLMDAKAAWMILLDSIAPSTLYVLYGDSNLAVTQIAKSTDAGLTWQVLTAALPPSKVPGIRQFGALALDPSKPSTLWLSDIQQGSPAIYQSVDGGAHWIDVHDFPALFIGVSLSPDANAAGILIDPKNSSRVYACCAYRLGGSESAVFRTDDGGKTWVEGGHGPTAGNSGIWPPVLDPRDAAHLYASWWGGVVQSTDAGQTWAAVKLPPGAATAGYNSGSLAIDPSGALYLVNEDGTLFRNPDGGANWTTMHGPWTHGARILALDPINPSSRIYVGSPGNGSTNIEHAFAAKLDAAGSVLWSTLIAGSQQDQALSVAVDPAGNAYVAGTTNSLDFPLVNPVQAVRGGGRGNGFDAFLTKIASDGGKLIYSTYLGGSGDDAANGVAVDATGNVYLTGSIGWPDFPTVNTVPPNSGCTGAAFVAKIDSTGRNLLFSTCLPGTARASAIAPDAFGNLWIAGDAAIALPLVHPIQPSIGVAGGSFIERLTPSGKGVVTDFSTYLGGASPDRITALALSPSGSLWMSGEARSPDFLAVTGVPLTPSGFLARLDVEPLPAAKPGVPLVRSVYNAASFRLGDTVSPGEIVSIFGAELAPVAASAPGFPLPQTLRSVSVTVGGLAAPLFYVSPDQINFQVPFDVASGGASLVVRRGSESSAERPITVIDFSPGIFTVAGDGSSAPIVVHGSDFSLVTPQSPAQPGEYVVIFCTGLGVAGSGVRAGDPAPPGPTPVKPRVDVDIDSRASLVPYAGLAPGFAGSYQVNFQIPTDETSGRKLVTVSMLGVGSNLVAIYVK